MKTKISSLIIFLFGFLLFSCKKNSTDNSDDLNADIITQHQADVLDSTSNDTILKLSDLTFQDGSSMYDFILNNDPDFLTAYPQGRIRNNNNSNFIQLNPTDQKKKLISEMGGIGFWLTNKYNHDYPAEGTGKPKQLGLWYIAGSKDISSRRANQCDSKKWCTDNIYKGLDCSGMIFQMAKGANLTLTNNSSLCGTGFLRDTINWNKALRSSTIYKDIEMENKGYQDINLLEKGDIIVWPGHIGYIYPENNSSLVLKVFQSNGGHWDCKNGTTEPCDELGPPKKKRGPSIKNCNKSFFDDFGYNYVVLRLKEKEDSTVTDIDGNIYHTVRIGTQVWMKENLKTTRYNDGTAISTGLDNVAWQTTTNGAYAIYNNNAANNTTYGKLYNWYAVNTGKLAPTGWHVPTESEWAILYTYLDGEPVAGGKMKSTSSWNSPNTGATNSSGFTGLPGGWRSSTGQYELIGDYGFWWSSTEIDLNSVWRHYLSYNNSFLYRSSWTKQHGFSVRCIKN
jgi:uncharacterized protein (TIGR02145 family)